MLNSTTRVESSQWIIKGVDERHWVVYSMLASLQWWALRWWEMRRQSEQLSMRSMLLSRLLVFFFLLFLLLLLLLLCLSDSLFPYIKYIGPTRRLSSFLWFTSQQQQQQHCGSTTAYRYSLLWCKYINFFFFFFVCHWSVRPAPLNRVDVSLHGFSFSLLSSVHPTVSSVCSHWFCSKESTAAAVVSYCYCYYYYSSTWGISRRRRMRKSK